MAHLQTLETVATQGQAASRQALGPLVTTPVFIDLVNHGLLVNRLIGEHVTGNPDTRRNAWQLSEAGEEALRAVAGDDPR